MLVVGVLQPLLLDEGGVLDQPELGRGDGAANPGRRGGCGGGWLGRGGEVEGTGGEGLHTGEEKMQRQSEIYSTDINLLFSLRMERRLPELLNSLDRVRHWRRRRRRGSVVAQGLLVHRCC